MIIKGLQKLTLLDYPDKMACTIFTYGCNFRCPFCQNGSLVLPERRTEDVIPKDEVISFLSKRRGILEGVCISGGEPTLMPDLKDFISEIKSLGYPVKLDTNGYRPEVLLDLIEEGLLDYVAMDIKNSRSRYGETTGIPDLDVSKIEKSCEILMGGRIPFEFRTTVLKTFHDAESIADIGRWLKGEERFYLQSFVESEDLICGGLIGYDKNEMEDLLNVLKAFVPNAKLRGV